jgi:hypothetical protein
MSAAAADSGHPAAGAEQANEAIHPRESPGGRTVVVEEHPISAPGHGHAGCAGGENP